MLIIRNRSANSDSRQIVHSEKTRRETFNFSTLPLAAAVFCCAIVHAAATAQIGGVTATVARSAPGATLYSGGVSSPLRQGAALQPGDMIDTGLTGRVIMNLSDGSQVIVFPGSRVVLEDFRSGGTWRDLLKVMAGRVRAVINHHGKRPNPYRVYSPIASIAVRGTDFLVAVEPNGATRVLVLWSGRLVP
ncbi:MAG TPA: FecR family protein [Blastocatellia bacterium]